MRITEMITRDESVAIYFINFSPTPASVGNQQGQQMRIQILILRFKGLKNWLRQERIRTPKFLKAAPFVKLERYYTRTVCGREQRKVFA